MKIKTLKLLCAASMSLMLAACGGGKGSALNNTIDKINNNSSSSNSSAFTGNTSSQSNASSVSSIDTITLSNIGFGTGNDFQAGIIGVGIGTNNLSAGGVTLLTVNLVSVTGTLVTQEVTVTFNSKCFAAGKATLSSTSVKTNNGEASTTYTAKGCVGNDLVSATVSYNSKILTAQTTLNVAMDTVQTVTFADATPTQISLKGTGGLETSDVRFKILGQAGAPIEGVTVTFSLNTSIGGLSLTKTTAKTNSQGYAYTTVQAGTIATSARVTATTTIVGEAPNPDVKISTQSSQLIVSTGIPDQKSMSLSTDVFNPAGWDYDNVTTTFSVLLADAFNNPAPNGTAVSFTTEGGSITSGCVVDSGKCNVNWKSQEPRPVRASSNSSVSRLLCLGLIDDALHTCQAERAGRITVLATAIGNESFIDKNGDGTFTPGVDIFRAKNDADAGDCQANVPVSSHNTPQGSSTKPCDDLPEAYLDNNESKTRGNDEIFTNFFRYDSLTPDTTTCPNDPLFYDSKYFKNDCTTQNTDSTEYTSANGLYNGVLCSEADAANKACSRKSVSIRKELVIVMSCEHPLTIDGTIIDGKFLPAQSEQISLGLSPDAHTENVVLADCNGNSLPAGTTVVADISSSENIAVTTNLGSSAIPNDTDWTPITLNFRATSKSDAPVGRVYLNVIVPTTSGKTTTSIGPIKIN